MVLEWAILGCGSRKAHQLEYEQPQKKGSQMKIVNGKGRDFG
jgi:hypothetical protein